jgi:hypothetical protein
MAVKATQAEEKEFDLETWLREGTQGLRHILKCKPPAVPEEFKSHTRAARKEMLLALRSLLDTAIQRVEETAAPTKR